MKAFSNWENTMKKMPGLTQRHALGITAITIVIVYIIWNIRELNFILYPHQLFNTYVHESGHALAALLTGGQVGSFSVSFDTSGVTRSSGGWRWLILPAGYLGSGLFGSLLFYTINRFHGLINSIAVALGVAMASFTVLFSGGDILALVIGVGMGMALLALGLKSHPFFSMLLLNILAVSTALTACFDLRYLMSATDASNGIVMNDVAAFSRTITPLIPPIVIAILWAGIALIMFGMALYYGAWKVLREEIEASYANLSNKR
jgi:hypothetical protein